MADHQANRDSHLSVEKVFQAVKGVNWRRFGEELIKEKRDGLYVDELDPTTNLDRIYSSYQSDEARLRAVVEEFLTETYDPPWRGVIWALYCADEIVKAQQISSYAELLQDVSLTVNNVAKVMDMVQADRMIDVWRCLGVSESLAKMINRNHLTPEEKTRACVDVYLNYYPHDEPSWSGITSALYSCEQMAAAKEAKAFCHENDSTLIVESLVEVMEKVTSDVGRRRKVWEKMLEWEGTTLSSYIDEVNTYYATDKEKTHALADAYINSRPESSWQHLVQTLYAESELAAAKEAKAFIQQNNSTLTVESLVGVMENVTSDKGRRTKVWERVLEWNHTTPSSCLDEIFGSDKEETHALADAYINSRPESSWQHLVQILYAEGQLEATKEAKSFLQENDPSFKVESLVGVMEKVTSDEKRRREVWARVLEWNHTAPYSYLDEVFTERSTDKEKTHALADVYINSRPESSWQHLIQSLYDEGEFATAKKVKSFIQRNDPTLTVNNVTDVMEKVTVDNRRRVWEEVLDSEIVCEIYNSHSITSEEEKLYSCASCFASKPESSWEQLVQRLYYCSEMAAAKEAKTFIQQKDPSLTVNNVTDVMEKVSVDKRREVWEDVDMLGERAVKDIYSSHSSEEEKIHYCADTYVTCAPHSSWEELVRLLYLSAEMAAAKEAKAFLQQEDSTFTVDSVTDVMEKVTVDKRRQVWMKVVGLGGSSHIEEIYNTHSSEKQKTHACSDMYVNCHPESSWEHLASRLYQEDAMIAVGQARLFLPPRDLTLTVDRLKVLFQSVKDPDIFAFAGIGDMLGLPESALEEIKRSYQSNTKRKEAYLDTYTHHHPCPSWKKISEVLRGCELDQQAEEVENNYVQVSERTQHNFDIAMKGGTLMIRNGSVFFLGPGGSGKTHTLRVLLQEQAPSVRQSTPCAKRTVRAIAQCKVGVEGVHFIRIQDDQYSDMLSTTAKQLQQQQPSISTATPPPNQSRQHQKTSKETSGQAFNETTKEPTSIRQLPNSRTERKQKIPQSHLSGFERELLRRMQLVPNRSEDLIDKDLIDMKDSGGQPMFHEVLPLFVKNTTFGVLTVKLNERLDSYPMVDYYSNGKPVGEPFPSPFTHLQTLHHCMRVLQSTCSRDTCPKLVFIGTHKDREQECLDENREDKNQKLQSVIPPDLKQSILYYEHSNEQLLFAVNVKTPENEDRKMMAYVRQIMIKELQKLPQQKIPLQYFALENTFLRLAKYQGKTILSKKECFREAAAYHFARESFEAALKYLHSLKLIFYYEEVLPEVVFIDAQTILDKITELVEFSLSLHSKPVYELTISMDIKEFQEFKAYGIVTLELLSQFSSHYVSGLFMQQQLVLLLKYLRVIAEVGKGKYLVPCLLKVSAIPHPLPHSAGPSIPALLFYFGPNGPKLGVYCCLLTSLITEAKWELMTENDRPVQVSRNQVQFALPGENPGCITIRDSFSTFFHVSITFPEVVSSSDALQICQDICPNVRETILTGVRKANQTLNYNDSIPKIAFPCSTHQDTDLHPASISSRGTLLTCTAHRASVCSEVSKEHMVWLGKYTDDDTNKAQFQLDQVLDCTSGGVPKHLGRIADSMYEWEGAVAEELGLSMADVSAIKTAHPTDFKLQVRAALEKWKQYNGSRATYRNLIVAFEQASHKDFASKVYEIAGVPSAVTEVKMASDQPESCETQQKHESQTVAVEGCKKPQLAKAFKFLIPIAEEWQNIGTLLELDVDALTSIATVGKKDSDRLREMLKLWLSQEDPVASWEALTEAVEPFNDHVAAKVKSLCT